MTRTKPDLAARQSRAGENPGFWMGELKDKASRYTTAFGGASQLSDLAGRKRKAEKIRSVLQDEAMLKRPGLKILDIGCSSGIILRELVPAGGLGIGIDIDEHLGPNAGNVSFLRADAERLPVASSSIDVVLCNHVYEHTDAPESMLAEIRRVLKEDGLCYFAGPGKYDLIEPHYGLPFLSWFPRGIADRYVRLVGKGDSYAEKPYSHAEIRALLADFAITEYTGRIVRDPERYSADDMLPPRSVKRMIALTVLRLIPGLFPGFVYVLRKPAKLPPSEQSPTVNQ